MRKILSAILTAMIIVSSVSVLMFTSFAADTGYSVTEYGTEANGCTVLASSVLPSENRLSGTPLYYSYNATTGALKESTNSSANSSVLYDGVFSHDVSYSGNIRNGHRYYNGLQEAVDNLIPAGTNCRFVLDMGNVYNINTFLVAGSSNMNPIKSFEIYVGDDKDVIFSEANKVAEYTRKDGSKAHQYVVTLDNAVNAKYFGVKILEVDNTVSLTTDKSIYLNELGAYGSKNAIELQTTLTEASILHGSSPVKIVNCNGNTLTDPTVSSANSKLNLWTNGRITDNAYNLRMWNATGGMTITYDLGNNYDISKVAISSGEASYTYVSSWEVYASNSADDLFNTENCYGYVENTTSTVGDRVINIAVFNKKANCSYIGIRILTNADTSQTSAYISEIAAYGQDTFTTEADVEITQMFGDNVIYKASQAGKTIAAYAKQGAYNANLDARTECHSSTGSIDVLYDNSIKDVYRCFANGAVSDTYGYHTVQVAFNANETYTVNSALLKIANKENVVSYIAYVGDSVDTLFQTKNILAISDNENGLYSGYVTVDTENAKTGSVFGIMITSNTGKASVWPDEIAFFEPTSSTTQVETAAKVDGKNLLEGKTLYKGSNTTVGTTATTEDINGVSVSKLTNNSLIDVSNKPLFGGTGLRFANASTANFVYDMESEVDISKVLVAGGVKSEGDNTMAIGAYGVFVGDATERDTLFDVSNRVALFVNSDYSQAQSFNLSALDINGQYVGVLIYGLYNHYITDSTTVDTSMYITEIAVYGNYTTDKYTVTHEPSEEELALKGTNALANVVDDALLTDGVVLTDDAEKAVVTEDADGTKLTYNMGGVMNITSLLVGGLYNSEKSTSPAHYRIYLSNDESTLYTDESLVVDYYSLGYKANSGNYAGSTQLFDLTTAAKAQYVGFEFVTAALGSTTLSLSELAVYATYDMTDKLSGTITSPEKVYLDGVLVAESVNVPADVLSGDHSLVVQNGGSNNVYIVNNGVFTHKSELDNALSTEGTQIRTDDPLAIRFVNNITVGAKAQAIKYGAVVAKTAALGSKDLLIDSTAYATVNAVAYEKDVKDIIFKEDSATVSFTAAIHNIGAKQHLTYYAVRPYMVVSVGGKEYTVYGEAYESRVYEVAKAALADSNANYSEKVMTYLNNIVNNSSLTSVSQALYTSYGLTNDSVAASVKNTAADNDRLIKVIQKAMRGEEITLGVLGGSITMGANVLKEDRYAKSYAGRLREWLENTFDTKVNLVNAGIGATTSTFGVHRIEKDLLQHDPDLVVLEYAVNETESETTNKTYEDCVRRILEHRNADGSAAALMLLFTVRYNNVPKTGVTHTYPENAEVGTPAYYNNQDAQMVIGNNYNLPMISYMDCIVPLVTGETPVLEWKGSGNKAANLTTDDIHPSYFGHQIISSLLSDYIATVAEDVTENTEATVSNSISTALYGATFTNAKFYNSCDLPEEWITSMGSFHAVHDICNEYIDYDILTHGWKAYSTEEAKPMVLDIPGAKSITLLMVRTKKIADGIKINASVTEPDGTVTTKNASNWLNSSNYADTTVVYTADAGKDLTVELAPNFNGLDGEIVLLGVMVGFDEK